MIENSTVALDATISRREICSHVERTIRAERFSLHTNQCGIERQFFCFGDLPSGGKLLRSDVGPTDRKPKTVTTNINQAEAILLDTIQRVVPCM